MCDRWMDEELEILCEMRGKKYNYKRIAARIGRTVGACQEMARRMGVAAKRKYTPWTDEEEHRLETCIRAGMTYLEIAKELGRSFYSVQQKIQSGGYTYQRTPKPRVRKAEKDPWDGVTFTDEKVSKCATVFAAPVSLPLTVSSIA